ncbi:TPA: restriction endonuclease subunit S [Vibrio cholerae]|uniref:restriction endonuclease subunit S n=1 Tax=Vibrio cholerae TaxID=666 RepID=UPI0011DBF4C9|nr:restriction endonuclease subunit S [Vibrio cholerae]EGR2849353.1 restriction endonuclease subunit S [Vibrio cholerae]EII3093331.1 restriction endonuclease subunit S [Vibrio cholerae]EJK2191420.1 restriction endonuclease subunit S [Vibrio cholerae]EKF9248561.1 restriction endonuclease subunit S [Vibrio cholerae]EKF9773032.1 restriction endonuclease subunit S [Vibrio cholerae]
MGKYQAYPEYKNSGIEWLGEIPTHWKVNSVKRLTDFQVGWTPSTGKDENFVGENLWANISDLKSKYLDDTAKRISDIAAQTASMDITPKGSLLYSFKLSVGAVSFANKDMYTNEAIASFLSTSKLPLSYLYYSLPIFVIENAATNIYGAKILNQELIKNAKLIEPTYFEAEKIANFLDHETAKIDSLIAKQEKLIELLKEKRQAVISHAVTKGLNPDAPMKDSGVEWLGEVPEHWIHSTLKHYSDVIDCKHITAEFFDDGIPLASIGEVKGWSVNLQTAKYTNEEYYTELIGGGRKPQVGDIIYSRNATVGEAAIVRDGLPPFAMGQDVCLIRLNQKLHPEFAMYILHSGLISQQLELAMVGSTFKRINVDNIRNFLLAIPPYQEQKAITEELERLTSKYDSLISNAESAIDLMKERKTALISAAVTGKIDVRHFVAEQGQPQGV